MTPRSIAPFAAALLAAALWAQEPRQPRTPQQNAAPQPQQAAPDVPRTASISGAVSALGTNEPIIGATVEIRRADCDNFSNPPDVMTAATNAKGEFSFQKLRAGGWCVVATAPGGRYMPAEYMQRGYKERGATLPVAEGQSVTGIQLTLAPTGSISGRVLDRDAEPLARARVQLLESLYEDGRKKLFILQSVPTDDLGTYRFFWVPPGRYYVAVTPEDNRGRQTTAVIPQPGAGGRREETMSPVTVKKVEPNGAVTEETYFPVYYPGDADPDHAGAVDLGPGAEMSGVDFLLVRSRAQSFHIRGTLTNTVTGDPAEGATVRVMPRDWRASFVMPTGTADAKGNFDIGGVLPGSYVLHATMAYRPPAEDAPGTPGARGVGPAGPTVPTPQTPPQGRGNAQRGGQGGGPNGPRGEAGRGAPPPIPLSARVPLSVGYEHVENMNLPLVQGFDLPGRARIESGLAEFPRGVTVSLVRDPDIVGAPVQGRGGAIQPDGAFTLNGVGVGDYRVLVAPYITAFQWSTPAPPKGLENTFVRSIRYDGEDVLTSGLHLAAAAASGNLEIVIGTGGTVTGTVVSERLDALPNVLVALVPETNYRKRLDLYRSVATDHLGRFKVTGVPPGAYKAFAWEEVERNAWQIPEFLSLIESRGRAIDVREGGESTADITAIPAARR